MFEGLQSESQENRRLESRLENGSFEPFFVNFDLKLNLSVNKISKSQCD